MPRKTTKKLHEAVYGKRQKNPRVTKAVDVLCAEIPGGRISPERIKGASVTHLVSEEAIRAELRRRGRTQ